MNDKYLVEIQSLKKHFIKTSGLIKKHQNIVKAVDNVSFGIQKGETLGLVGESGCGKSTLGRTVLKLYQPTDGKILYNNADITNLTDKEMLPYRKKMQMIFQDPYASLNSRMTISDIIGEAIDTHNLATNKEHRTDIIANLLQKVGLLKDHMSRYPHEFSGGQRQRIGIARALAVSPEFIICDEPISALDVSIQAQVINMLEEIQAEMEMSYLFIAHDLSMVKHISNRIGVMYLGQLVEIGDSNEVYTNPQHPYTQALLSAIPVPNPTANKKSRIILDGDVPSPLNPPSGCRFRTRCKYCMDKCSQVEPQLKVLDNNHSVACHLLSQQ
ncbi:MAG: peptide ABC transporter ATP-binding protein [Epulopiscium sp. Nele67-Bin004]|nr:MAG: peptide ABC transporter ATP-binding protein [Epulopiscium sp. Nele67-Bin004]